MRWEDLDREACSVARTLSVVGDRWTLMILRECFLGTRRFEGFEARLGIARHVLADRLKKLTDAKVLDKVAYQERPRREEYRLTEIGRELHPVIVTLAQWGDRHMAGPEGVPLYRVHDTCGQVTTGILACAHCGEELTTRNVSVAPGPGADPTSLPEALRAR